MEVSKYINHFARQMDRVLEAYERVSTKYLDSKNYDGICLMAGKTLLRLGEKGPFVRFEEVPENLQSRILSDVFCCESTERGF